MKHIAFTDAVQAAQTERGSRGLYDHIDHETEVTDRLRGFLATVDTAFLATASADGQPYVQHRGGPRGFLRALDAGTIGFLDFSGNRQYISTGNLAENDRVCLIAIDYATRRRIKIWGRARRIPATPELVAALGQPGYKGRPEQAILIAVEQWDINCPQHIPQKLDAADVARAIARLEARIAELEAELRERREMIRFETSSDAAVLRFARTRARRVPQSCATTQQDATTQRRKSSDACVIRRDHKATHEAPSANPKQSVAPWRLVASLRHL